MTSPISDKLWLHPLDRAKYTAETNAHHLLYNIHYHIQGKLSRLIWEQTAAKVWTSLVKL